MYSVIGYLVKPDGSMCEILSFETESHVVLDSLLWQNRYNFSFDVDEAKDEDRICIEVLKDGELFYCD